MGTLFIFSCPKCGHEVEVSGGKDFGFAIATNTILCKTCKELYNVVTSNEPWNASEDDWVPKAFRCPKSKRHVVELWSHPGPCPKCQDFLTRGNPTVNWD
jgi:hypothetical protein